MSMASYLLFLKLLKEHALNTFATIFSFILVTTAHTLLSPLEEPA